MKKILLTLMIIIIAIPVIAKDPKETVEYWESGNINKKQIEATNEIDKCWNDLQTHFIVPVGSKQWNICCAIRAAYDRDWDGKKWTFEEINKDMKKAKEMYGEIK